MKVNPVWKNFDEFIGKLFGMSNNATIFAPSNNLNHLVMGQKSVYNIITAQQINGVWGIADVAFSITSLRKAQMQMQTIIDLTKR